MTNIIEIITGDASSTFFNKAVGDYYHSQTGAQEEAVEKYAKALKVWEKEHPIIFDVCFGLGYNSAAALETIQGPCTIYCFENDTDILQKINRIEIDFTSYPLIKDFIVQFLKFNEIEGNKYFKLKKDNVELIMVFGDFRQEIKKIEQKADFVFFDPFSPKKLPKQWTEEIFSTLFSKMKRNSKLATYSYAKEVRNNMKNAGFEVIDGPIVGRHSPSTIAIKL